MLSCASAAELPLTLEQFLIRLMSGKFHKFRVKNGVNGKQIFPKKSFQSLRFCCGNGG